MNITYESHQAALVFCITGDLTTDDADNFKRTVQEHLADTTRNIILDCKELGLVDSVGLESLLWLSDELNHDGNKLKFASVPETVQRIFELTRLNRVFSVHETVEQAARSFA
ncbi:MAG: STAS domain-containing protein [Phycisphaerales bacterium]|nr:STAS domain-containing protein [Planctomycetota bacterium]MBL6998037.1 STAS domain-containing protein [Phycisphaerales bacterium]